MLKIALARKNLIENWLQQSPKHNRIILLWTLLVPIINQNFPNLSESCTYDWLIVILGLQ